jgi:hypothetical protein
VPTQMHTKNEDRESPTSLPAAAEAEELLAAEKKQAKRVRRLKINVAAWVLGTILIVALWVISEWGATGAFERFATGGNPGDWNPTLPALGVGIWGLVVGIKALRVRFERPPAVAKVDREVERLAPPVPAKDAPVELRRLARQRLERIGRLKFHVAAWALGMIVITPLNALIEWQDNGDFERFSGDSQPGSWDPWVLYVAGIWAAAVVLIALWMYLDWPRKLVEGVGKRLRPGH